MSRLHTHYENLKVARDAPLEVVRAAYRALAQKYHPDRNHGDHEAARVMAILNEAYRVLSDSHLRGEHDQWIRSAEALPGRAQAKSEHSDSEMEPDLRPNRSPSTSTPKASTTGIPHSRPNQSYEIIDIDEAWEKFKKFFGAGTSRR